MWTKILQQDLYCDIVYCKESYLETFGSLFLRDRLNCVAAIQWNIMQPLEHCERKYSLTGEMLRMAVGWQISLYGRIHFIKKNHCARFSCTYTKIILMHIHTYHGPGELFFQAELGQWICKSNTLSVHYDNKFLFLFMCTCMPLYVHATHVQVPAKVRKGCMRSSTLEFWGPPDVSAGN